ncbi:hypothetical protein K491DRAFT_602281 [Lophiostoma macrostomum CBS 122681]|uniref:SUN domain-containing protein n=1 Tax=Lophiostoma macrostomum CBS 122681 TaxID=1314788 RepID=A0A6A6T4J6_9PLEO|nr:hypothetical protein K491DRAFT_602281 [Lophiostoma macrostomum CBS 122681]
MLTIGARLRKWTPFLLLCSWTTTLAQPTNETAVVASTSSVSTASSNTSLSSPTSTSSPKPPAPSSTDSTCAFRTINYITHTLPQQCLKTGWTAPTADAATASTAEGLAPSPTPWAGIPWTREGTHEDQVEFKEGASVPGASSPLQSAVASSTASTDAEAELETDSPLDNANFLSFEEWKKKNLERAGQSPDSVGQGRLASPDSAPRQRPVNINALDSLGDEAEIELDFSGFGRPDGNDAARGPPSSLGDGSEPTPATDDEGKAAPTSFALGKDAGKTCKERFNYASFDCAATVLKTNNRAKSSSSVLVENKDSYMLNECSAQNKFVIVELCDDILVDTVVLANYEFFSSMFRHFRVSVSDRYPVKMDRWRTLGTFEARNSRDIQAFLITEPQIWARYLRIEFLTHYGNEFYCPISLLRVHGTTMMEQFRREEEEARGEEDFGEPIEAAEGEPVGTAAVLTDNVKVVPSSDPLEQKGKESDSNSHASPQTDDTSQHAHEDKVIHSSTSSRSIAEKAASTSPTNIPSSRNVTMGPETADQEAEQPSHTSSASVQSQSSGRVVQELPDVDKNKPPASPSPPSSDASASPSTTDENSARVMASSNPSDSSASPTGTNQTGTTTSIASSVRTASNSTNNGSQSRSISPTQPNVASPTTQESFFKSIHKRLQQLEANSTLSLQYIEEQSRILRDAFMKVEKRQLSKTEKFLDHLNSTVMQELKSYRGMYDQLWQSTILELEGMKERQRAEIGEIGARLSLVADELVWQKRMAVVQSTLLLLCLGLVLFVRSGTLGSQAEVPIVQQLGNKYSQFFDSPPRSPENAGVMRRRRTFKNMWRSDTSALSAGSGHLSDGVTAVSDAETDGRRSPLHAGFSPPTPTVMTPSVEYAKGLGSGSGSDNDKDRRVEVLATQSGPATPRGSRDSRPSWEEVDRAVDLLKAEEQSQQQQDQGAAAGIGQERRHKRSPLRRAESYDGGGSGGGVDDGLGKEGEGVVFGE